MTAEDVIEGHPSASSGALRETDSRREPFGLTA